MWRNSDWLEPLSHSYLKCLLLLPSTNICSTKVSHRNVPTNYLDRPCKPATARGSFLHSFKVRFPSSSMSLSARKPTAAQKIRPLPRSFARSRLNGLTSKSKFLSARSQRAARSLILQLNNDMRSELWQASGGVGSRGVISQRNDYRGRRWEKTPLEEEG